MPVTRPAGRALIIGSDSCRAGALATLQRMGFTCAEIEDPYSALAELCRRPLVYRALILSLASLYREELAIIQAVKRRWPHVDIWLTHTDGRHAALADAMRLGADGLISPEGLHRTAATGDSPYAPHHFPSHDPISTADPIHLRPPEDQPIDLDANNNEPILTAEELRALLAEQPILEETEEA